MYPFFLFLTPIIITLIAPLRWALRFWAFMVTLAFGFSAFSTQASIFRDEGEGIGYILVMMSSIFYGYIIFFILISRLIVQAPRLIFEESREKKPSPLAEEIQLIKTVDGFLFVGAGIVASFHIFRFLAFSISAFPHGFFIHGALSAISIVMIGITLRSILRHQDNIPLKAWLTLGFLCGMFILSAAGIFHPHAVIQSAQNIAGENPYCISLNKRHRPPISMEDLTLLTMDKSYLGHHAFLLVENQDGTVAPYHWSYLQSKFLPGVVNWAYESKYSTYCRPKTDFASDLPLTAGASAERI